MQLRPSARALVRLAAILLVVGALAGAWHVLASQSIYSPWRLGVLPEPIAQLERTAFTLGLLALAAAWLVPWVAPKDEPTYLVVALYAGSLLTVAAMIYGASRGMMGLQIDDMRLDAKALFAARITGEGVLFLCLLDYVRRIFKS